LLCCAATGVQPNAIPNAVAAINQVRDIEDFIQMHDMPFHGGTIDLRQTLAGTLSDTSALVGVATAGDFA
jgi:hypothetical protein